MLSLNISIVFLFVVSTLSLATSNITQISSSQLNTTTTTKIQSSNLFYLTVAAIGIILIIVEFIVWWKSRRERTLISFTMISKDTIHQIPSQSNNVMGIKSEVIHGEESHSKDESPVIQAIKQMTQDHSEQKDTKKKRKRKVERISDRRSKEVEQIEPTD